MKIITDPHNKFLSATPDELLEACGLLPIWLANGEQPSLKDRLIENYSFYMGEMKGGNLSPEGLYTYPGDEDLYPLVSFESDTEICYIFKHAIVGVFEKENGSIWVTRMD